jgi:hypothetical protein
MCILHEWKRKKNEKIRGIGDQVCKGKKLPKSRESQRESQKETDRILKETSKQIGKHKVLCGGFL